MNRNIFYILKSNIKQLVIVFIAFTAMIVISYFYVKNIVKDQTLAIGEEIMNTTQVEVTASLSEAKLAFSSAVNTIERMVSVNQENDAILHMLTDITEHFTSNDSLLSDFMKMYAYINDEFLDGALWEPPDSFDPKSRPWFIGAKSNDGEIFFTEPYIDAHTGELVMTFSKCIHNKQGAYCGIAAMDLNLTHIINYIKEIKLANNGYGILLSDSMSFAAHREDSLIGLHILEAGKGYEKLHNIINENNVVSAVSFIDYDGVKSIAFIRTIMNGWHIGVITPSSSYYHQISILAVMLNLFGFVIMAILGYLLIKTLAEKKRTEEESRSKSSFLARMSHEMRTPMNAIIGMTNIAKKSDDILNIKNCLDKIDNASSHLLGVINDVLDMSNIESDKFDLIINEFYFDKMIQQIMSVINYKTEEKNQILKIEISDNVPKIIITDFQRLSQVITHLLSNAFKFSPDNSMVKLLVRMDEQSGSYCVLHFEVIDNGIGILPEQKSLLFKPFVQGDGSISRKYGGSGLGLAISKKIVEAMDGSIDVVSTPGQGSVFMFNIRAGIGKENNSLSMSTASSFDKEDPCSVPDFSNKRILLAEDIDINREILAALLSDTGIKIDFAENGEAVYDLFSANGKVYNLIFMDIHMPEMDGYEATRKIRALDSVHAKTIPIIAMSASVLSEDIAECLSSGMNGHVGKPLILEEVLNILRMYLK